MQQLHSVGMRRNYVPGLRLTPLTCLPSCAALRFPQLLVWQQGPSPYELHRVPQVIDLSKEQERTKQQDARTKEAEFQAAAKQYAIVSDVAAKLIAACLADASGFLLPALLAAMRLSVSSLLASP